MKRWFALLVALALLLSTALADEGPLVDLLPLADAAAAAAVKQEGDSRYCGVRSMAADWNEDMDAFRWLVEVYLADDQLENLSEEQYAQVEWLDQRAVVELRKDESGWKVTSFSLDAEWEMEMVAQDYFVSTMREYSVDGFSIQYPAVFGEENVEFTENGGSGAIEGASFKVEALANSQQMTTETILTAKKQEISGAETNMNQYTGVGQLTATVDDQCMVYMVLATAEKVYQAELRYDQSLIREFMLYGEYMLNSFSVSEAGNG